jgi:uncharacterized membrane protein
LTKPLIFVKATAIALGIVLVVLMMVLLIVSQKQSTKESSLCQKFLEINTAGEVEKMEVSGSQIIILTKPNPETGGQEIIKLNSNCAKIINHFKISR